MGVRPAVSGSHLKRALSVGEGGWRERQRTRAELCCKSWLCVPQGWFPGCCVCVGVGGSRQMLQMKEALLCVDVMEGDHTGTHLIDVFRGKYFQWEQQNPLAAEAVIFTSCYMIWWPQCVSPFGKNDYFVPAADNRRATDLVFSHNHPSSCAHCPHTNTHPSGHERRNTASADIKLLFYLPKAICIHNQTPTDTGKLHTNTQSKAWEWKWKDEDSLLWDKSRPSPPAMFQI